MAPLTLTWFNAQTINAQTINNKDYNRKYTKNYSRSGDFVVQISEEVWRDSERNRDIPVKIYNPRGVDQMPIILFSHGLGGNFNAGTLWAQNWASHGYMVISMQHQGSDESLWKDISPLKAINSMKSAINAENLQLRVDDVHDVINHATSLCAKKQGIFAKVNCNKIGMSGHSFGAQTTLAVSGQQYVQKNVQKNIQKSPPINQSSFFDSRIISAISFSPNARQKQNLDEQFGQIKMPFLSITGTKDSSPIDNTQPEDRILPWEHMSPGEKYLAIFNGGDHSVFSGQKNGGPRKNRNPINPQNNNIENQVNAVTLAFWDSTLKQNKTAKKWPTFESSDFLGSEAKIKLR